MRVCPECKIPYQVSRDLTWGEDGTVYTQKDQDVRMGFIEMSFWDDFITRLSERAGKDKVFEALSLGKYEGTSRFIETILKGPLGYLARSQVGARRAYTLLTESYSALGLGRVEIDQYKKHKSLTGNSYDVYSLPCMMGDLRATFEVIERVKAEISHKEWPNQVEFKISRLEGAMPEAPRAPQRTWPKAKASVKFARCATCGLPTDLSTFKWDPENGIIIDSRNDERVFMMGLVSLEAMWKRMHEMLGDMVWEVFREANVAYGEQLVESGIVGKLEDLNNDLLLKGLGSATVGPCDCGTVIEVTNPFNKYHLEGRVVGVHKALKGKAPHVNMVIRPGLMRLTVSDD